MRKCLQKTFLAVRNTGGFLLGGVILFCFVCFSWYIKKVPWGSIGYTKLSPIWNKVPEGLMSVFFFLS